MLRKDSPVSTKNFSENWGNYGNLLLGILLIQGAILSFAWFGFIDEQAVKSEIKTAQIQYFQSKDIVIDTAGNPADIAELTPAEKSFKEYYDALYEAARHGTDGLFFALLLTLAVFRIALTTVTVNFFVQNLRNPTEKSITIMVDCFGINCASTIYLLLAASLFALGVYFGIDAGTLTSWLLAIFIILLIIGFSWVGKPAVKPPSRLPL